MMLIVYCFGGYSQIIDLNDTLITSKGVAGISFRNSLDSIRKKNPNFKFTRMPISDFGITGDANGYMISYKSDNLFFLCPQISNNDLVGGFEIFSSRFVSPKGIHPGDAIKDCQTVERYFFLVRDRYIEDEEYFDLKDIPNLYGGSFFSATIRFKSQSDKRIGMYRSARENEKTSRFTDLNIKSQRISLFRIE